MPQRKRKEKPMTLDRLARMVKLGFEETRGHFVRTEARFEFLAGAAHQEFQAVRHDMATSAELTVLREDLAILRRDAEEGFRAMTATLTLT